DRPALDGAGAARGAERAAGHGAGASRRRRTPCRGPAGSAGAPAARRPRGGG
ncbi:MAG: hypothetical protein AVDCRST_MAG07-3066, partial [uncultured Frankineae bacterium]